MSQMPPPPPPTPGMSDPYGQGMGEPQDQGWSLVAIFALITGIIPCTAPIGLLLGLVGVFTTGPGKKHGRGMSILAIVFALATGSITGFLGYKMFEMGKRYAAIFEDIPPVLKAGPGSADQAIGALRLLTSDDFDAQYSDEDLKQWLQEVADKHGKLQDLDPNSQPMTTTSPDGRVTFTFQAMFVNGKAPVSVSIDGTRWSDPRIVNIAVDGFSPSDASGGS
jgi:hypothetical protein